MQVAEYMTSTASAAAAEIEYGVLRREELASAAELYVRSFPARVGAMFQDLHQARRFFAAVLELHWLAQGETFFVARAQGNIGGLLILSWPSLGFRQGVFRRGFAFRFAGNALCGRFGSPLRWLPGAVRGIFGTPAGANRDLRDSPHVSVVAVEPALAGRGIGTALLERARAAIEGRARRMWLLVEKDNKGAIRLYQRLGYRILRSDERMHTMVWDFVGEGPAR
jgi:ribosomal protein S18 acetylase RimI-like enzyme